MKIIVTKLTRIANFRNCTASLLLVLLAGCGSTETPKQPQVQNTPAPEVKQVAYTSDDYLEMAKQSNDSPTYLLKAAQTAQQEQNFAKSLIIAKSLNLQSVPLEIKQQVLLVEARGLLATGDTNGAEKVLHSEFANLAEIRHQVNHLKAQLYSQQKRYVEALRYWFEVEKAVESGELPLKHDDVAKTIWFQLNQLPDITLNAFEYNTYTNAKSWLQLVQITRLYTGEPAVLQRQLKQWYDLHPYHTAMSALPESFQRSLSVEPFNPQKIAVLLPFTGKFRKQAQAIRNGLLVANQGKNNVELMFIDSELPLTTVEQKLTAQQAQFIIGPLHKEKVEQFAASPIIAAIPTLFLNRVNMADNPNQQHFYFGLTPEDEAEQAAKALFKMGYKKPSIIAPNNSFGKRLGEKFSETWLSQRSQEPILTPEISFYTDQAEMQRAVKGLMDVDLSKQRISRLRSIVSQHLRDNRKFRSNKLFTETRNRKDLDVIYVIGNAVQTRLLKPFIDVNTSPFTTPIPVYGTSRSHAIRRKDSDKRDLRSLTFTEIPWLLEEEIRYDKQRALFKKLWPTVNSQLKRMFALGFDALNLIDRIAQLRVLNGLTEHGMSGLISVDQNGFINRQHLWAKYNSSGEVEQINLD